MALTDRQKLYYSKLILTRKIESQETWNDMKTFINSITGASVVKAFIKSGLSDLSSDIDSDASGLATTSDGIDSLVLEFDTF